ncbi:MAG TPA: single-stranded DNA-binding protein [Patescibacteria group bacterium]|nr:single-stranded DNA-binding protein [Patescibacteria group bacterium]
MARSLNKVELIGNLTRDPELRYTPQGTAVCTFGIATNRGWVTDSGEKKEEAEFHRIVAWNKLAELCSQLLTKGRKIYVEGRLANRSWTGQDGAQKSVTEIVINDMIILDNRREQGEEGEKATDFADEDIPMEGEAKPAKKASKAEPKKTEEESSEVNPDDIPF